MVMNALYTAVHFVTYEATKSGLMEISPESSDKRLVVHATAGAAAGALAAAVTTPLDMVKTQLQCQVTLVNQDMQGMQFAFPPFLILMHGKYMMSRMD